jgi:hypothetical protein
MHQVVKNSSSNCSCGGVFRRCGLSGTLSALSVPPLFVSGVFPLSLRKLRLNENLDSERCMYTATNKQTHQSATQSVQLSRIERSLVYCTLVLFVISSLKGNGPSHQRPPKPSRKVCSSSVPQLAAYSSIAFTMASVLPFCRPRHVMWPRLGIAHCDTASGCRLTARSIS